MIDSSVLFGKFLGVSVPPITPSDFETGEVVGFIWNLLAQPEVVALIISGLGGLSGMIIRNKYVKKWRLERAVEFLAAAVRETYEEYVREAKRANSDGKLTQAERDAAMNQAIERGKEYCKQHGFDLFKVYAKEFVPVLVERIIGTQKWFGKPIPPFSEIPEPPLPDLLPK